MGQHGFRLDIYFWFRGLYIQKYSVIVENMLDGWVVCLSLTKATKRRLWEGKVRTEKALDVLTTSLFSGRSVLGCQVYLEINAFKITHAQVTLVKFLCPSQGVWAPVWNQVGKMVIRFFFCGSCFSQELGDFVWCNHNKKIRAKISIKDYVG